jgi:hypothetical protein
MSTRHCLVFLVCSGCGGELSSAPSAADGPAPAHTERPHFKTAPDGAAVPAEQIWFLPAQCGVEAFRYVCGARGEYRYPEVCVAGDNDGDPDAYFVQSGKWSDDPTYEPMKSRLFQNDGDKFTVEEFAR